MQIKVIGETGLLGSLYARRRSQKKPWPTDFVSGTKPRVFLWISGKPVMFWLGWSLALEWASTYQHVLGI